MSPNSKEDPKRGREPYADTTITDPERFVEHLLSDEEAKAADARLPDWEDMPPWYDEALYRQGCRFFWDNSFACGTCMLLGLVAVVCIPSILATLIRSQRSSTPRSAYSRYASTLLHIMEWLRAPPTPSTAAWRSLREVRRRHAASTAAGGRVSQRDLALTQYGFFGMVLVRPDGFGAVALRPGDWDAYVHVWRVVGALLGVQDRYNIAAGDATTVRRVCELLGRRAFVPHLEHPPEHFEHMTRVLLDGMYYINPTTHYDSVLFAVRRIAGVPGYVLTEEERLRLLAALPEKGEGVPALRLLGLEPPKGELARVLRAADYEAVHTTPQYAPLSKYARFRLQVSLLLATMCSLWLTRLFLNMKYLIALLFVQYLPYAAFRRFGRRYAWVNHWRDSPRDHEARLLPNEHYRRLRDQPKTNLQQALEFIW